MKQWKAYLEDIVKFSNRVILYTKDLTITELIEDYKTYDAVLRNIELMGEAVKNIPPEVRGKYPEIEWKKVTALSDLLTQETAVNDEVIWNIITKEVPEFKAKVIKILEKI